MIARRDSFRRERAGPGTEAGLRVGIEVGGTFTDLVAIDRGRVVVAKVPSTPARPDEGALAALDAAAIRLGEIEDLVHGSTVATNAILERKGARVAFFVTAGFRDLLLLQRHDRKRIYDLFYQKPEPVVGRADSFEIVERIDADGEVVTPLDVEAARRVARAALSGGAYGAVAICFLNSYANPDHEERVADLIRREHPDVFVTHSAEVTREFREYERATTTTLSAYVRPVIDSYVSRLEAELGSRGFRRNFSIMQSNGGRLPVEGIRRNAIACLYSGPAAGVMGAVRQAGVSGFDDIVTLDMGGTSTDVCLVRGGRPDLSTETEINGLPVRAPVIDIATIGAGGGSIVWVDDGGMLRVGPESTGADPGPACYGRGGTLPAVTDAHLLRGTLKAAAFVGGRMSLDRDRSEAALTPLAERFGMSLEEMADAALRVADANIVRAIQLVSTERGRDPRGYVLVPFGGAGPLHAARVAEELEIGTVVVPPNAGVLSAFGLLAADFLRYDSYTRHLIVEGDVADTVREVFAAMKDRAVEAFAGLGLVEGLAFTRTLEMRFVGQAFEIPVTIEEAALADVDAETLVELFVAAHHRVFAFGDAGRQRVEIVSFRLGVSAPPGPVPTLAEGRGMEPFATEGAVFDRGERTACAVMSRSALGPGSEVAGPALVADETSTIYVPGGWTGGPDEHDNLVIRRSG